MNRREFLCRSGVAAAGLALGPSAVLGQALSSADTAASPRVDGAGGPGRRPNVVFVFADQLRAQSVGCLGNDQVKTPRIDRFAGQGLTLTHAIAASPVCTPYRGMLITGRYPCSTGIRANDDPLPRDAQTLGEIFKASGYTTGYIGKWHLAGHRRDPIDAVDRRGWDYWAVRNCSHRHGQVQYWVNDAKDPTDAPGWEPEVQAGLAAQFVERHRDAPFLLVVSMGPPHDPYRAPESYLKQYEAMDLKPRPNCAGTKNLLAYYAMTTSVDHSFGIIVDALERQGLADNTIVVFTSDHGDMLGSQGLRLKQRPFAESIDVPFFVRYPGRLPAGGRRDDIVSPVDILPTLAGFCGVKCPAEVQGLDCSGTWLDPRAAPRREAELLMIDDHVVGKGNGPKGDWRGIRTRQWVYAEHAEGPWVMYDLVNDPYQFRNLVGEAAARGQMQQLRQGMNQLHERIGDNAALRGRVTDVIELPARA